MAFFRSIVSFVIHQRVTDPTSGFQALSYRLMRFFAKDNYPSDFPDADTLIVLAFAGFRLKEVPVTMRERISGASKMHANLRPLYYVIKMLLSISIVLLRQRTRVGAHYCSQPASPAPPVDSGETK